MSGQESYDFEIEVDKNTKLKYFDFSLRCSRPDLITVWILRRIGGHWKKIGKANIVIDSKTMARWGDIVIGSDSKFIMLNIPNPDYPFRVFRGKGIGSKTVQLILEYLSQHGIEKVYGEISKRDIFEKASNFWKKNGFTVTRYAKPKGSFVAKVAKNLK